MNLTDLIGKGALIDEGVTKRSVEWDGNSFDIYVKNEMSAADFEFIFGIGKKADDIVEDDALFARQVHRLVRIGSKGEDAVPHETARRMKTSLLIALSTEIGKVQGKQAEEVDPKA